MFIQIAPKVKVYVTSDDMEFISTYSKSTFRDSNLSTEEQKIAKRLADKAVLVRKKLDNDTQYALNRKIRFVVNDRKK